MIFELLYEAIVADFLHRKYKKFKDKTKRLYKKIRYHGEKQIQQTETVRSLTPATPAEFPCNLIAEAIVSRRCLVTRPSTHYSNPSNTYHIDRRLKKLESLLDSDVLGQMVAFLSKPIVKLENHVDVVLYLNKRTNQYLADRLKIYFGDVIKRHPLAFKQRHSFITQEIDTIYNYELGDSLEGANVVLLESVHVFPDILEGAVKYILSKGAKIQKVLILFNGTNKEVSFADHGIPDADVVDACKLDLKLTSANVCNCGVTKRTKRLSYSDY